MWRVVAAERFSVGLIEVERDWTLADVEQAHLTLDLIEDAETLAMERTRKR